MRIENSLKNIFYGISGQVISAVLGFVVRTIFIYTLGIEFLGVDGLFSSILLMLSLANLGFDTAMIYSLYNPLANDNHDKIQALMKLYQRAYRWIGMIILGIGLALLPFLSFLMNGETSIKHIEFIYFLFLLNSVLSYYFVYKQSLIIANQQQHIISKVHSIFLLISNIAQIILLLTMKNYIVVLIAQIVFKTLENIYIANRANKLFPFIKDKNHVTLSKAERKEFYGNLYSIFLYKISGVVINGTDNIVISKFVGLIWVGIYSNYLLIINTLNTFLSYIFYSLTASVGNLNVTESNEKKYFIFRVINFASFWVFGLCSICLWNLMNPFIEIWLGDKYILDKLVVFTIILNFYTSGLQNAPTTFREATGLFKKGKYRPIIAAVINLVTSIILAKEIGMAGILLGTVLSRLCTYFWYDPFVIFKFTFHKPVWPYFIRYLGYSLVVFILALVVQFINKPFYGHQPMQIFIQVILCFIIPNAIFLAIYSRTEEFIYLYKIGYSLISKLTGKVWQVLQVKSNSR